MKRYRRRIGVISGLLIVVFLCLSWHLAYRLTGPRHRGVKRPLDFPFPLEDIQLQTFDGETIKGWFVAGKDTRKAIVLLHGYGGDRRQMLCRAKILREQGWGVLLYDARACGESSGDMITFGYFEAEDLLAAVDFLKAKHFERIACLGVSQGGATILLAADRLKGIDCVICESVYDEMDHALDNRCRHYLKTPAWLVGCTLVPIAEYRTGVRVAQIKPVEGIARLTCPVFVISGAEDEKTTPADAERLFAAAGEPKELWMVPGAGHRDLFGVEGYSERMLGFLRRHVP